MSLLIILIVSSSFIFLFLFQALHTQDLLQSHQINFAASTGLSLSSSSDSKMILPPLMAFVEESPSWWLQSRPLPRRNTTALKQYVYPSVKTCSDIPNRWPVDHPVEWDNAGFGSNVGVLEPLYPVRYDYAKRFCPVDADPFLPWIHDVFVNQQVTKVEFIAHNKRRCRTAPTFAETDLKNLEPQVALLQSVPVKRLNVSEVKTLLPREKQNQQSSNRYRLASLDDADEDGRETRFICQFHTLTPTTASTGKVNHVVVDDGSSSWTKKVLGETLSVFPYNYEHANFRKSSKPHPLLTRPKDNDDVHGAHNEQIWNSLLLFSCPVPPELQSQLREQFEAVSDTPSIYLDLVPIRTPPREDKEGYCPQLQSISKFRPDQAWGNGHVLPPVEKSGRWANIPLCGVPPMVDTDKTNKVVVKAEVEPDRKNTAATNLGSTKSHYLVGCLWASATFKTRGAGAEWDMSTSLRLLEWLTYHLFIAKFDHVYIYDNTAAHTNETSLEAVTSLFPANRVTRIPWKFRVCNNNRPAHPNAGERSSQYAAEASCRVRYGPTTEWMSFFDADEYFIAQGNWSDLKTWLRDSVASGAIGPKTNILSFFQTRALPNIEFMEPFIDTNPGSTCTASDDGEARCLAKATSTTFLEAYDCEPTPLPKPDYGFRAKKQIFRPRFVLNHFVHYTTVTQRIHEAPEEPSPPFVQRHPYERRVNELSEAFMLHTKTTSPSATVDWKKRCQDPDDTNRRCPVGIAWPLRSEAQSSLKVNTDGLAYNCFKHHRIQNGLGLEPILKRYKALMASVPRITSSFSNEQISKG